MTRLCPPALFGLLISASLFAADGKLPPPASGTIEFPRDVEPIFAKNCLKSHGAEQQKRGLRLDRDTATRAGGSHNSIDAFVLAKLAAEHLAPSPEADRPTLIRRLSLDLSGLPPSPAEVDAFVHDPDPEAYEGLVDRLLASPRYGERWARH